MRKQVNAEANLPQHRQQVVVCEERIRGGSLTTLVKRVHKQWQARPALKSVAVSWANFVLLPEAFNRQAHLVILAFACSWGIYHAGMHRGLGDEGICLLKWKLYVSRALLSYGLPRSQQSRCSLLNAACCGVFEIIGSGCYKAHHDCPKNVAGSCMGGDSSPGQNIHNGGRLFKMHRPLLPLQVGLDDTFNSVLLQYSLGPMHMLYVEK